MRTLLLLILMTFLLSPAFANECLKTNGGSCEVNISMQIGVTSEVLDLAREYFESHCMLLEANQERVHLHLPQLKSVCPPIKEARPSAN